MKAVIFQGIEKNLKVTDVPMPKAGVGELVFKVGACGICGSDLHAVDVPGWLRPGQILGHEYGGTIVEVGPGVDPQWQVGERLMGENIGTGLFLLNESCCVKGCAC